MDLNFKEALATLSRALPEVLVCAGAFVAGGFLILLQFGFLLFAFGSARVKGPAVFVIMAALILLGGWATNLVWQRFFLYRHQAAMLFLFSGGSPSQAFQEVRRFFPAHSNWAGLNHRLRQALFAIHRDGNEFPDVSPASRGMADRLVDAAFSRFILSLAFSRGGTDVAQSLREGLALCLKHGTETRRLARRWLGFSSAGLALLFLCLSLSNWLIFTSAGAPVMIGIALAAVMAGLLHQAFVVPLALAGVTGALLAETKGCEPDPDLCEKIAPLLIP